MLRASLAGGVKGVPLGARSSQMGVSGDTDKNGGGSPGIPWHAALVDHRGSVAEMGVKAGTGASPLRMPASNSNASIRRSCHDGPLERARVSRRGQHNACACTIGSGRRGARCQSGVLRAVQLRGPELVGHSFAVIPPEQRRALAEAAYRQVFARGAPRVHRTMVPRADDTRRCVESRMVLTPRSSARRPAGHGPPPHRACRSTDRRGREAGSQRRYRRACPARYALDSDRR